MSCFFRKKILKNGKEEIFLDMYGVGDIPKMRILIAEDVHNPGKTENLKMAELEDRPGSLGTGII